MVWTYTANSPLTRCASEIFKARTALCALSPYVVMTDPVRTPCPVTMIQSLPNGSALIYRHFGRSDRHTIADQLRRLSFDRDIQLLIGADEDLARQCGADGVHLPQRDIDQAVKLRRRYPNWILTAAAHDRDSLARAGGLDAVFISPIFDSRSPGAVTPLGVDALKAWTKTAPCPVIALGGINHKTAPDLLRCGIAGIAGIEAFAGVARQKVKRP